ncbi:MAG: hypothetical protein IPM17_02020 [Verrucomicrobia bacterium]|nr:hypothetical protein [Verrucomicrobiota bacterium]
MNTEPFCARARRVWTTAVTGLLLWGVIASAEAAVTDAPFQQSVAVKYRLAPELQGAQFRKLVVDNDGIAYVLSDRGVARVFGDTLAPDRTHRPLAGKLPRDITLSLGEVFYLFEDHWLSNARAGEPYGRLPAGVYSRFAVAPDGTVLLAGTTNLALYRGGQIQPLVLPIRNPVERLYFHNDAFYVVTGGGLGRITPQAATIFHRARDINALAFRGNEVQVGAANGIYALDLTTGAATVPLQTNLPCAEVNCLVNATNGLWVGTARGAFLQVAQGRFRYFASRRWLEDDFVVDLQPLPNGDCFVLTRFGLTKIEFRWMTLAQKAAYYDEKIRNRHIRYGFCSELKLSRPGDPTSAEMIDTDNDGTWSSYYMASQAFRYAVTGDERARANAWETFAAIERTQTINQRDGYPARTFERLGFKFSDPERWHPAPDGVWEWKSHTSSDEITCQTFGYAVMWEVCAVTPAEKQRLATLYERIIGHILRNNLYLVDVDGQPTLWGRWNPEYVNWYPPTIVDRRLNSAEIVAFLQFAYRTTGKETYRQRAFELFEQHGYLQNITNSMANIRYTPGYEFKGNNMGDEWNHSDDELAFFNYWTLYRFAFNDQLRRMYVQAIRDHWQIERVERNPCWNFIYGMTGAVNFEPEAAVWTLQRFPLDLVNWTIQNSHRRDIVRLPANFRDQQSEQLLPPDERRIMRWNGNPFVLDGGDGGVTELAGDEFLLPYWMGRYLKFIR